MQVITDGQDNQEDGTADTAFDEVIDDTDLSLPTGHNTGIDMAFLNSFSI